MSETIGRRTLLAGAGAALVLASLPGCRTTPRRSVAASATAGPLPPSFAPLRASTDRISRITVCTRPFRAMGPRLESEQVGSKTVVHNYGHGGSGWSLSWGSAAVATQLALATGEREIGVVGCGALGLTSALALQRAGARVTIYAKEFPPYVRSSLATGLWTPDSRICLAEYATPSFKQLWESMARKSFDTYQTLLGLPGTPVEFIDSYTVSDTKDTVRHHEAQTTRPAFAELQHELIDDLVPHSQEYGPGSHPFANRYLRRNSLMMFNLTSYSRLLVDDFVRNGGRMEMAEFHAPADLGALRQKTLINATGYGAVALFKDASITPVRGQLARVIPQPEINYGLFYKGVSFVPRRDGLVFQAVGEDDYYGFGDDSTKPDTEEAARAVNTIAGLFTPA